MLRNFPKRSITAAVCCLTIKNASNKIKKPSKKIIGSAKNDIDIAERFKFVMFKYRKFMVKNNLKTAFYHCYA
jgi:hypothetical protein